MWTPWYRWHPELALRYLPMVEKIQKFRPTKARRLAFKKADPISILEIGSGGFRDCPVSKNAGNRS